MSIAVESAAFANGKAIPRRHSGDGEDLSPPLAWSGVPASAQELVMIVDDPDAPTNEPWVHWVIYRLAPTLTELPEGVPPIARPGTVLGSIQGKNSWNALGYRGPAPPKGHGLHHYRFTLYALDQALELSDGLDKADLLKAIKGHVVAEGRLVGTYER
jgi:Raf kinase inhibitor-like YbhB/YbcL family protein